MVSEIARARQMLDQMPDQVFELWLEPIIRLNGWPFANLNAPCVGNFREYFGAIPLNEVAKLHWHRSPLAIADCVFNPNSKKRIQQMMDFHIFGRKDGLECAVDGEARFMRLKEVIAKICAYPAPIVLLRDGEYFQILDGYHRITALFALVFEGKVEKFEMDCWIGERV
jgi:hypothetical protein